MMDLLFNLSPILNLYSKALHPLMAISKIVLELLIDWRRALSKKIKKIINEPMAKTLESMERKSLAIKKQDNAWSIKKKRVYQLKEGKMVNNLAIG